MKNSTSTPVATLRDGAIKATIWSNLGEKGTFYSVQITRTYKDDQGYHDTSSFSGSELLRVARLMNIAYDEILIRRNKDKAQRQEGAQSTS
tara:strand:- start:10307 stop:10579 length:273 start_codon:yes stop_codon:yes gene_type:complete